MDHADHVHLLRGGIAAAGGTWADLGSGTGAFTLALADVIGPTGVVYSVDKERRALQEQEGAMRGRFPAVTVHYQAADFTRALELPPLDGLVIANALHFQRDPEVIVKQLRHYLKANGRLLLVEYNVDKGNWAVPYPISFQRWSEVAGRAGFRETRLLARRPSRFLREIYSAVSLI